MMKELQLLQDPYVKRLFLVDACLNLIGILLLIFFDLTDLPLLKKILLCIILISNGTLIYFLIFYINKRIENINNMLTNAINGNVDIGNDQYNEGILYSMQYQFAMLFSRINDSNNRLSEEKENIHKLITELSHQIKTPLSSIKIFNTLLNDSDIELVERDNIIYKMEKEIDKLDWLSSLLLDISKLETGLIKLNTEETDISKLITDSINAVYIQSMKKQIEIQCDIPKNITIALDKKWTKEAFINILDNAIKYTDENGSIEILVKQSAISDKLIFKDNGRGISTKDISHIFERFYKGENSDTENGTGIGLYLADKIIRMQGFSIKVKSQIDVGTEFEITIYK